MKATASKLHH